jgi:hypothetical protein
LLDPDPDPGGQTTNTEKSKEFSCFEGLDVPKASPVACASIYEGLRTSKLQFLMQKI